MDQAIPSDRDDGAPPPGLIARLKWWFTGRILPEEVDLLEEERVLLRDRIPEAGGRLFGLSLSGGGIRSASFALGVMQGLEEDKLVEDGKLIDRLHYMSTVSGGGYTGSSFTWFRHNGIDFPFGERFEGSRTTGQSRASRILTFIRLYGDYLLPTRALGLLSALGLVIWAMVWSWLIYITLLFVVVVAVYAVLPAALKAVSWLPDAVQTPWSPWMPLSAAIIFGVILLLSGTAYVGLTFFQRTGYFGRRVFQRIVGALISLAVAAGAMATIPIVYDFLKDEAPGGLAGVYGTSALGVLSGVAAALYRLYEEVRKTLAKSPWLSNPLIVAGAVLLIFGMLLLTYAQARAVIGDKVDISDIAAWELVALPALMLARLADLNRISFHGLYRDRLMEVFMPEEEAYKTASWKPSRKADRTPLSATFSRPPYHIINANVILSGSTRKEYRARGGDNFILTPLFCGSDATGYQRTRKYLRNRMSLPSAMAISGAAVNPNSGVGGQGVTRNFWVSLLLSLLNVRLGYWVRRPEQLWGRPWAVTLKQGLLFFVQGKSSRPDFYNPGLSSMIQGGGREDAYYVELSDGGHFENTGLYELARRRLDVIVISDASADPDFTFADFGNAIERVRVDFGALIRFCDPALDLAGLIPKSGENQILRDKFGIARRGYAIGTISYDEQHVGVILYIKPTMISDLTGDIFAYRAANAEFPHQPTLNQFFGENQLEAYRELGYQLSQDAFAALKVVGEGGSPCFPPQATEAIRRFFKEKVRGKPARQARQKQEQDAS